MMNKPTEEQKNAIDVKNNNVIVSAGAGSGKTFVLKERVLRILKDNDKPKITDLVILTFTKNAAAEMKERIRKIINEDDEVNDQASLVDSAYITTFDSYAQSIVKKYNYELNMSKDFGIIDENIVSTELKRIIDDIFERNYNNPSDDFKTMIYSTCYKDDDLFRKDILNIYKSLGKLSDKNEFLTTYIDKYYSEDYINKTIDEYTDYIFDKKDKLVVYLQELLELTLKQDAKETNEKVYNDIYGASTLDELKEVIDFKTAGAYKGWYDGDVSGLKDCITSIQKKLIGLLKWSKKDMIDNYLATKIPTKELINILIELDNRISEFKDKHNSYEFSDIALKAIDLVKNHKTISEELKNSIKEIMIDEYQDTNDIQEEFVKYIQNKNVYMVGDVKQSIYRFRNANPYIFKDKYDNYSTNLKDISASGIRIDMTNNFRSRDEVISNINDIFSSLMSNDMGGADYKKSHKMNHGQKKYDELVYPDSNFNLEVLNYNKNDLTMFKPAVIEAFIMAKDIKERIKNKKSAVHEVNKKMVFEPISYKDFCILVDKSANFELIKKVFEYEGIPSIIDKNISIKEDDEVFILKNLITLLISINNKTYDYDFKHAYMSVARSYIWDIKDQELYDIYTNNTYSDTPLFKKLEELSKMINGLSNREILTTLIDEFDIINKLVLVGDIKDRTNKLEFFVNNATNLNKFGYDIYSLKDYFDQVIDGDEKIEMESSSTTDDAVKIMTIHGSKGLEFNYVYLPYLYSRFKNNKNTNPMSIDYGIFLPYYRNEITGKTYLNRLDEIKEEKENMSEKIRLLYVAITRAKEQFIMINNYNENVSSIINPSTDDILNCNSYRDMISLLNNYFNKYTRTIDITKLGITDAYNEVKETDYKSNIDTCNKNITVNEIEYPSILLDNKHFSKPLTKLIDRKLHDTLNMGTYMHYVFEVTKFNPLNVDSLDVSDEIKDKVKKFFNHDISKNIKDAKVYKEHEIRFMKDGSIYHGFIDLLVEYPDHFDIIDYKLSNLDSEEYVIQLNGYKDYIEEKYHKPTNIYLYSINKDIFKKLN